MIITENAPVEQLWSRISELESQLQISQNQLTERDQKITTLTNENGYLEEQLAWFKRQLFGKRSERITSNLNEKQLTFEGFEIPKLPEKETQEIKKHSRRKSSRSGQDKITLSPDLPVQTTILDIPEEQKRDPETGEPLVQIGVEITHKLAHKPGSYYIKEIIRPKYAHPKKEEAGILTAELPDSLLPKCRADESLLAEIITKKFVDHMPLYRIAESMGREGIQISRKLLSQWVIRSAMALKPLYNEMVKQVLESGNVFIDEVPVKLQQKNKCKQAYMWVLVGGQGSDPPYRIYDFRENRCHQNVWDILNGYRGVLHSDKYQAYQRLAERNLIIWCPCYAHIRRKFFEAESGDPKFREWVLRKIRYLFMLERIAWVRSPGERLQIRQEKEIPIIDELIEIIKGKLFDNKILPKSKLREAIGYFCGLIPYLKNYTQYPFARLDNNVGERAGKAVVMGRKNWMFFGSPAGGEAGAILFSIVQTCRGLGINPREYLEDIARKFMSHPARQVYQLLPDQWLLNRNSFEP